MHDPSSSSSKQPRMATRTSDRVVSENHPIDTSASESPLHGFDPIKVMPLAMVPLVDPSTQISCPIVPTVDRNPLVDETLFVRLDNREFEYVFSVDHCVRNVTVGSVPVSKSTSLIDENMFDKSEIVGSTYGMVVNISPVVVLWSLIQILCYRIVLLILMFLKGLSLILVLMSMSSYPLCILRLMRSHLMLTLPLLRQRLLMCPRQTLIVLSLLPLLVLSSLRLCPLLSLSLWMMMVLLVS